MFICNDNKLSNTQKQFWNPEILFIINDDKMCYIVYACAKVRHKKHIHVNITWGSNPRPLFFELLLRVHAYVHTLLREEGR